MEASGAVSDDGGMDDSPTPRSVPSAGTRWRRRTDDRVVAGVASGAAAALGISVGWARFLFVALALFGGFGLLLYVVGWLTMPEEGSATSLAQGWLRGVDDGGRWLGIGLIVIGAVVFFSATGLVRVGWLWAGLLLLAGVLLYQGDLAGPRAAASPEPPGEPEDVSPGWEPAPEAADGTDAVYAGAGLEAAVVAGPSPL